MNATDCDPVARLVDANDRLLGELNVSRSRVATAKAYLDRPGLNQRLGAAALELRLEEQATILATIRANRAEALRLLGDRGTGEP